MRQYYTKCLCCQEKKAFNVVIENPYSHENSVEMGVNGDNESIIGLTYQGTAKDNKTLAGTTFRNHWC